MRRHAPAEGDNIQGAIFVGAVLRASGNRAEIELRNRICEGDEPEILSPHSLGEHFPVRDLRDAANNPLSDAAIPNATYILATPLPLRPGDLLRRRLGEYKKGASPVL